MMTDCSTDVVVSFTESLHVYTGLLTVATVSGGLSGILVAALLYVYCLKHLLLTRQGYNARRLLDPDDGMVDNNQSVCVSNGRKEPPSGTDDKEKRRSPMNSDVAAFATRAKVVYPINQKYRPLADGASNPSLCERSKLPALPNEDSSSLTDGESLSQEQDNDDSSQFVSSSLVPKCLQNQSFTRASDYPQTLSQPSFEGRISLYCLALQEIHQHYFQLHEDKCLLFLQILKIVLNSQIQKNNNVAEFSKNLLQMQEKEVNELKKALLSGLIAGEKNNDLSCTLEEIERAEKDLLESDLQLSKRFSKQVEDLCQHLSKRSSVVSEAEAQEMISSVVQALLLVENYLKNLQEADLKRIQRRLLWWEELTGLLQSQPALLTQEASLRLGSVATMMEQLTSDDALTFADMETILSDVRTALNEGLHACVEECRIKTKELLNDKCSRMEAKRKKLLRNQSKEKSHALENHHFDCDLQQFTKAYQHLLMKHRQQLSELELQEDERTAEILCDHWKKLRSCWSRRFGELAKDVFIRSVPAQSSLSAQYCEELWVNLEQGLGEQFQEAECAMKLQLEAVTAQLNEDEKVWGEEMALVQTALTHLKVQQTKILRGMTARQSFTLNSHVGRLMEEKHEQLLAAAQRSFVVRRFCLHLLQEMRLSKLKALAQTDFRATVVDDPDRLQSCAGPTLKTSVASLAEKHLGPESLLVSHSYQQEFLSELETGTELLQSHAQLLLGNALSRSILQKMEADSQAAHKQDHSFKRHLMEAVSESVYVTKDSLAALVQSYHSHLQDVIRRRDLSLKGRDQSDRRESGCGQHRSLLRELLNWSKKPTSAEFQHRVENHKRKVLEQCDLEEEIRFEEMRKKKVAQDETMERIKTQLLEEEESFIQELTALARVAAHRLDGGESCEEDSAGHESVAVLDLLSLNPALDPAVNPSLTPSVVAASRPKPKKREQDRQPHLKS